MGVAAVVDAVASDAVATSVVGEGLGEAAVSDAALTDAAGASTLSDGTVVTANGTVLNSANAVDAATASTGATASDGSSVVADSTSPSGFSANGNPVNIDGSPFTDTTSAFPTSQVSALNTSPSPLDSLSTSTDTGSGLNLNSVTNPNYTSMGLNAQGAVPGLSAMGGAQGLTLPESTVLGDASATGTLSASGVTGANANPILDKTIAPSSSFNLGDQLKQVVQSVAKSAIQKQLQPQPQKTTSSPSTGPYTAPSQSTQTSTGSGSYQSAPPSLTPLFTGNTLGNTGTFLSPLNPGGLSASQLNQLYTMPGLGETTTPNIVTGSAEPSGGVFPIQQRFTGFKEGGLAHAHKPEFVTGITGHYAQGSGTGQSDNIRAVLKDGDYVMDADIVASLGDGSNKAGAEALHHFMNQFPHKHYEGHSTGGHINAMIADGEFVFPASLVTALGGGSNKEGAKKLDEMREKIREHKRSASINKIPPKAKSPLTYMEGK